MEMPPIRRETPNETERVNLKKTMLSTLSLIVISFISVLWTFPAVFLLVVRVRLFKVTTRKTVVALGRQISARSTVLINGTDPAGFFFGRWYIGYVHETESAQGGKSAEVYVLCTAAQYKKLTGAEKPAGPTTALKIWERSGNFFRLNYNSRELDLGKREVREEQARAIEKIKAEFNRAGHAVAYIHGKPGAGKSMTALLLAQEMSASLCKTFNPTEPGDNIADVCAKVAPTKANPLIIVFDEVDIILRRIENDVPTIKYIPTAVRDKTSWNSFLDDIDLGMYPWVIIVMTSNKSPEWVEQELDPSYIRPGRVNVRVSL